jgi:8-oxo-dGTP pyrophosphatase MutT (NUDIX family)
LAEAGPEPGTELNRGEPTKPRQAATVILLRGGSERLEVLLAKRNPAQRFMGGAWVFPGGAVDTDDGEGTAAHRAAGVREVTEEVGIALPGPDALVRFSRWITPALVKIRFDTHFFLAAVPGGTEPEPDGAETVDAGWFTPRGALEAHERDEILLVFPTIKHLEELESLSTVVEALESARSREIAPVQPRIVQGEAGAEVLLPGERGYDA